MSIIIFPHEPFISSSFAVSIGKAYKIDASGLPDGSKVTFELLLSTNCGEEGYPVTESTCGASIEAPETLTTTISTPGRYRAILVGPNDKQFDDPAFFEGVTLTAIEMSASAVDIALATQANCLITDLVDATQCVCDATTVVGENIALQTAEIDSSGQELVTAIESQTAEIDSVGEETVAALENIGDVAQAIRDTAQPPVALSSPLETIDIDNIAGNTFTLDIDLENTATALVADPVALQTLKDAIDTDTFVESFTMVDNGDGTTTITALMNDTSQIIVGTVDAASNDIFSVVASGDTTTITLVDGTILTAITDDNFTTQAVLNANLVTYTRNDGGTYDLDVSSLNETMVFGDDGYTIQYDHKDADGVFEFEDGRISANAGNTITRGTDGGLYRGNSAPAIYAHLTGASGDAALQPLQYQVWQIAPKSMVSGSVAGLAVDATTGYPIIPVGDWEIGVGVFDGDTATTGWGASFSSRPYGTVLGLIRVRVGSSDFRTAQTSVTRSISSRLSMQATRSTVAFSVTTPSPLVVEYMNLDSAMTGQNFRMQGLSINIKGVI